MDTLHIPQLTRLPEQTWATEFEEFFPDLETLTPIKGKLQVQHRGNYLEITAKADTIVTLTCDRCLQHYNHRLSANVSELIWLEEPLEQSAASALEVEVPYEGLVETLTPQGEFNPTDWLYQQLCLALPQRKLCASDCAGIAIDESSANPAVDRRWASLESLKQRFSS